MIEPTIVTRPCTFAQARQEQERIFAKVLRAMGKPSTLTEIERHMRDNDIKVPHSHGPFSAIDKHPNRSTVRSALRRLVASHDAWIGARQIPSGVAKTYAITATRRPVGDGSEGNGFDHIEIPDAALPLSDAQIGGAP